MATSKRPFYYGGQAIYEGVMIRGQKSLAMAVRNQAGEIVVENQPLANLYVGRLRQTHFVRGVIVLLETLILGTRCLMRSADMALSQEGEEIPSGVLWSTVALGLALGVGLFLITPLFVARYAIFPYTSPLLGNILEGVLRLGMFIAYLKATRLMPDIRRIYAYHGAEHKVVNAFENGEKLELESARRYSTAHMRCGTSFLLIVLVIAILVYSLAGRPSLWLLVVSRIALIPLIVGIGYELIRLAADHGKSRIVKMLLSPGLALQSLTTAEPTDSQVEVALTAMRAAVAADIGEVVEPQVTPAPTNPSASIPS